MKLAIIIGTIRQNRQTPKQARWVLRAAEEMEAVEAEIVDIKDYPMPFFEEPMSPRYNQNRQIDPKVQKWINKINEFDAYVFVTPEYNHSIPGVLKNAFDYLTWEMQRKPAAIVSHGTVGGARAAMHLKEIISEARAVPIPNFVVMQGMSDMLDKEGHLSAEVRTNPYGPQNQLETMLDELQWYSDALETAREREAVTV